MAVPDAFDGHLAPGLRGGQGLPNAAAARVLHPGVGGRSLLRHEVVVASLQVQPVPHHVLQRVSLHPCLSAIHPDNSNH